MISIFLLGIYNGFFIAWAQKIKNKELKWSKYWHVLGRFIILFIMIDSYIFEPVINSIGLLTYCFICLNLSWTIFNLNVNIIRKICGTKIGLFHLSENGVDALIVKKIGLRNVWLSGLALIIINIILILL